MGRQSSIGSSGNPATIRVPSEQEETCGKRNNPHHNGSGERIPEGGERPQQSPLPRTNAMIHDPDDGGGIRKAESSSEEVRQQQQQQPLRSKFRPPTIPLSRAPFRRRRRTKRVRDASGTVSALLHRFAVNPRCGWCFLPLVLVVLATMGGCSTRITADARPLDDYGMENVMQNGMDMALMTVCFGYVQTDWNVALAPFGHEPQHDRYTYEAVLTLPRQHSDFCGDINDLLRADLGFPENARAFAVMVELGGDCDLSEKATNALLLQEYMYPALKYVIFYSDEPYDPLKHHPDDFPSLSLDFTTDDPSDPPTTTSPSGSPSGSPSAPTSEPTTSPWPTRGGRLQSDEPSLVGTSTSPSWESIVPPPLGDEDSSRRPSMVPSGSFIPSSSSAPSDTPSISAFPSPRPTTSAPTTTLPPTLTPEPTSLSSTPRWGFDEPTAPPPTFAPTVTSGPTASNPPTFAPTATPGPTATYPPTTYQPTTWTTWNPTALSQGLFDNFRDRDLRHAADNDGRRGLDHVERDRDAEKRTLEENETMIFAAVSNGEKDILLGLVATEGIDIMMALNDIGEGAPFDLCKFIGNGDMRYDGPNVSPDDHDNPNEDVYIPPRHNANRPTQFPTNPPTNSYYSSNNGNRNRGDNYSDNAPSSFTIFKFFLFGLLIASPCIRAMHMWYSGGGRIRLRRSGGETNRIVGLQYIPPMDNWFGANEILEGERPVPRLTQEQVMNLPEIFYKNPVSEEFHAAKGKSIEGGNSEPLDGGDDGDDNNKHVYNEDDDIDDDDDGGATVEPSGKVPLASSTMPQNNTAACTTTTDVPSLDEEGEAESVTSEQFFENEPSAAATTSTEATTTTTTTTTTVTTTMTTPMAPIRLQLPTSPERVPSTFTCTTQGFSTDDDDDDDDENHEPPASPRTIIIREDLPPDEEQPEEPQQQPQSPQPQSPPQPQLQSPSPEGLGPLGLPLLCRETADESPPAPSFRTQRRLGVFTSTTCTSCSICLEEYEEGERIRLLPKCGHAFHTECILPWLTDRQGCCPLCKTPVLNDANPENNDNNNNINEGETPGTINNDEGADNAGNGVMPGTMR